MATTAISGIGGKMFVGANEIADIKGWSLTKSAKLGEVVTSSTGGRVARVKGATDWTAKVDFVCDGSTPTNLPAEGASIGLILKSVTGGATYTATATPGIVESIDINLTVSEEPVSGTVNISGNGGELIET